MAHYSKSAHACAFGVCAIESEHTNKDINITRTEVVKTFYGLLWIG